MSEDLEAKRKREYWEKKQARTKKFAPIILDPFVQLPILSVLIKDGYITVGTKPR